MRMGMLVVAITISVAFGWTAGAQQILVLDWQSANSYSQVAAANLGYSPTVVNDEIGLNAALPTASWDLVVIDNGTNYLSDPAPLATFIDSGAGAVILNYWGADDPSYQSIVVDRMGANGLVDFFVPQQIYCWEYSDPVWTAVNPITGILPGPGVFAFDIGDNCDAVGTGVAVGGFLGGTPAPGRAAIVRNRPLNDTIIITEMLDVMDPIQAVQLWENLIEVGVNATPPACFPVTDLTAVNPDCNTDTIELTWSVQNPGTSIEILRDGILIDTVGPTSTAYTDSEVPDGFRSYGLQARCGSEVAPLRTTIVNSTSTGAAEHLVLRLEDGDGLIDSAAAIVAAITNSGDSVSVVSQLADAICLDSTTVVWVVTGTYPDNFSLDAATANFLVDHIQSGGGLYFEGGDTWGFDSPTVFASVDGVEDGTSLDGDGSFVRMDGAAGNIDTSDLVDIDYEQDQTGTDYNDQIFAATADSLGPNSTIIWTEADQLYNTGTAYRTDFQYGNVICQSWEFGGFVGDQNDLYQRYREFLSDRFLRGNLNGDMNVDVSDAVFGMAALFVPSSPPLNCIEAGDVNRDGQFDVSDMVYLLGFLFVPGSPAPAAPFPDCAPAPAPLGCHRSQC